jgi:hypothetical protein
MNTGISRQTTPQKPAASLSTSTVLKFARMPEQSQFVSPSPNGMISHGHKSSLTFRDASHHAKPNHSHDILIASCEIPHSSQRHGKQKRVTVEYLCDSHCVCSANAANVDPGCIRGERKIGHSALQNTLESRSVTGGQNHVCTRKKRRTIVSSNTRGRVVYVFINRSIASTPPALRIRITAPLEPSSSYIPHMPF